MHHDCHNPFIQRNKKRITIDSYSLNFSTEVLIFKSMDDIAYCKYWKRYY